MILTAKQGCGGGGREPRSLSGLSWINRLTIKAGRRAGRARPGPLDSGNGYDRAENCRRPRCSWSDVRGSALLFGFR